MKKALIAIGVIIILTIALYYCVVFNLFFTKNDPLQTAILMIIEVPILLAIIVSFCNSSLGEKEDFNAFLNDTE